MNRHNFIHLIKSKFLNIIFIIAVFLVIAALFTFLQPLKYKAENKILIEQNINKIDPYNIAKINDYYSSLIKEVVLSDTFFVQILNNNSKIDKNYFNVDTKKQTKLWQETVAVEFSEAGTLKLKAYHPNPAQAKEILQTINNLLVNKNSNFETIDKSIEIKNINQIFISDYPVKPNIIKNFIFALILGFITTLLYIYYLTENNLSTKKTDNRKNYIPVNINNKIKSDKQSDREIDSNNIKNHKDIKEKKEYNQENYSSRLNSNEDIDNKEGSLEENESIDPNKIENKADINNLFK
jgi:capsular polysaccharide biosynthesis protein